VCVCVCVCVRVCVCVMGNVLGEQVNDALSEFLHMPDGRVELGFQTRYCCRNATVKPVALRGGLWLTGTLLKLEVSANTVGTLFGSSSVKLTAHGIRLCISQLCPTNDNGAGPSTSAGSQGSPQKPSQALQGHLKKLKVELRDIELKLQLVGHQFLLRSDAVHVHPVPGRWQWSFQLDHEGVKLQLGGKEVVSVADGGAKLRCQELRNTEVEHSARIRSTINVDDLFAVLHTIAAIVALAASEAVEEKDGSHNGTPHYRTSISWGEVHAELQMFGDLLLRLQCRRGEATITPEEGCSVLRLDPLTVTPGTGAAASEAELVVRLKPGAKAKVQHGFDSQSRFPPWRSAVNLIKTDERFTAYRAWLTEITDGFDMEPLEISRKRPLGNGSASSDGDGKRRRQ